jgi:hypothetical protein
LTYSLRMFGVMLLKHGRRADIAQSRSDHACNICQIRALNPLRPNCGSRPIRRGGLMHRPRIMKYHKTVGLGKIQGWACREVGAD